MATATESNPKFDKLAGELESWSIMEIAQFGKYLQDRWGVRPRSKRRPNSR